jgi:RNA polymerase sigma-70 factor, ECF subfamily
MAVRQQFSDEGDIVARLLQGDRDQFVRLYDEYSGLIYGVALRILRNAAAAQDIVQDVFLQLWRNPTAFNPERGRLAPWLAVVTRHKAVDALRKLKFETDAPEQSVAPPSTSNERCAEAKTACRLMAQLPPEQRQVLELAYLDGLTHMEIASRLGQPLGTVKSRIRLGLLSIRKEMAV